MMWIWIGLQYCMMMFSVDYFTVHVLNDVDIYGLVYSTAYMMSSVDYFTVHVLNDVDMDWSTVLHDDVLCGLFYSTCIE